MFGDSITESLKGTIQGLVSREMVDIPAVWRRHFGDWLADVFAIAGTPPPPLLPHRIRIFCDTPNTGESQLYALGMAGSTLHLLS
jgi:hypothetical protein